MKKSSMKTAPKGSTPPTRIEKSGVMYHGLLGDLPRDLVRAHGG